MSEDSRAVRSQSKLLSGLIWSAAFLVASLYLLSWYNCLFVRTASINFEGPIIWASTELAAGHNIYPADAHLKQPWICILYPPLYMILGAAGAYFAGISYFPTRLLSLLSTVLAVVFAFKTLRLQGCSKEICLAALTFYFGFGCVLFEACECRPDMLSFALGVWALYSFVSALKQAEPDSSATKVLLPAILTSLSCLAKQQGIVYMAAMLLTLLSDRKFKAAARYLAVFLICTIGTLGIVQAISGGLWSSLSILSVVKSRSEVLIANLAALGFEWIKIITALLIAPLGIWLCKPLSADQRLPLFLFFISCAVFFYTMGIPASSLQHLLPALFGLSWWLALCLRKLPPLLCLLPLLLMSCNAYQIITEQLAFIPMEAQVRSDISRLRSYNLENKLVLCDDVYINLLSGSKPALVDCASFINSWKDSGKGFGDILTSIEKHEYAAIVISATDLDSNGNGSFWPPELVKAIKASYVQKETLYCGPWILALLLPAENSTITKQ